MGCLGTEKLFSGLELKKKEEATYFDQSAAEELQVLTVLTLGSSSGENCMSTD